MTTASTDPGADSNGVGFEDNHRRRHHPKVPILSAVTVVNANNFNPTWSDIIDGLASASALSQFSSYLEHPHPSNDPQLAIHSQSQLELLAKLLRNGKIDDAEIYDEEGLQILRWHKLAINASMNPTSIFSGGLPFPVHFASIERILESTERAGERSTIKPSMLVDWELGRPLEIEAILGHPIRIAARAGIKLNRIQSMYAFLTQLQLARSKTTVMNQTKI
ncbi:hypothetical protein H4Q26_011955 [Puccinia striiformis f. sp. tritici PST-130]|nr:hypothetical protein H4Q26_011955 [Puccinia striiformis f. sp. tritici PST-130]